MNQPDEIVLKALQPYMTDEVYAFVVSEVAKAGGILQVQDVVAVRHLEVAKRAFGSRSAAGQYAANVRWGRSRGTDAKPQTKTESIGVTVDGKPAVVDFEVSDRKAADVKFGDTVLDNNGQASWVTASSLRRTSGGYDRVIETTPVQYSTNSKGGLNTALPHDLKANPNQRHGQIVVPMGETGGTVKVLTPRGLGKGKVTIGSTNPSRRINTSAISREDLAFINAGKTGPERVQRRNSIIEQYAAQGKDVTIPPAKRGGGAQWLGPAAQ